MAFSLFYQKLIYMISTHPQPIERQIQVVIRIKPQQQQSLHFKSVYLSQENSTQLVVQTPNKKQYFLFDQIADESCTQIELYKKTGESLLKYSEQGYNCCIFAYGQTGAGKTYSVFGKMSQIVQDIYTENRGILPRLLYDLFSVRKDKMSVTCSYMQIYNEQIYDLLNSEIKTRQIRQNFKNGVYVEGISQEKANNYQEAMEILLRGIKHRKVASTFLNKQSSRSHTIFTIKIEYQIKQNDNNIKIRKSKINIVDLAGSERTKQAKVEGQRLKEGCNINKSLHILGNVINALVQSNKKKKHVPFRDSKLTYYLKDSLSGNSITKLLANIEPNKKFLGDTLSTLMFAKRAKILRIRAEANEQSIETCEPLRGQVRKLRSELAEAKFIVTEIKADQKNLVDVQQESIQFQKRVIESDQNLMDKLQLFQQNQLNYKALISIYQQRLKNVQKQQKKHYNFHNQWKSLQQENSTLKKMISNFPAFTKIFRQNLLLRNDLLKDVQNNMPSKVFSPAISIDKSRLIFLNSNSHIKTNCEKPLNQICDQEQNFNIKTVKIIEYYQKIIDQISSKTKIALQKLQQQYLLLLKCNKQKDEKIKQINRRKDTPQSIQALIDQNQYLKLNILQLQQQINKLEENQLKKTINLKFQKTFLQEELNFSEIENSKIYNANKQIQKQKLHFIYQTLEKLQQIKQQAQKQIQAVQQERNMIEVIMLSLKQQIKKLKLQNKQLSKQLEIIKSKNSKIKKKLKSYSAYHQDHSDKVDENTFMDLNLSRNQNLLTCKEQGRLTIKCPSTQKDRQTNQRQKKNRRSQSRQDTEIIQVIPIINAPQSTTKKAQHTNYNYKTQISQLKVQINIANTDLQFYKDLEVKSKQQFKKSIEEIIQQYRKLISKQKTLITNNFVSPRISNKLVSPSNGRVKSIKFKEFQEVDKCEQKIQKKFPPKFKF